MWDEGLPDCGIEELYGAHRVVRVTPQTVPTEEYSWQSLQRQPYGLCLWDIVLVNDVRTVVFMAREPRAQMLRVQDKPDAIWKGLSFGYEIEGRKVMPLVVMILFVPLQTIYEVYFNFYGETGEHVQEALRLLGKQPNNYLFFHDRGAEPVRKFGFPNSLDQFFRGHYGMISAVPAWSDDDFNEAKRRLMDQYSGEQMWGLQ